MTSGVRTSDGFSSGAVRLVGLVVEQPPPQRPGRRPGDRLAGSRAAIRDSASPEATFCALDHDRPPGDGLALGVELLDQRRQQLLLLGRVGERDDDRVRRASWRPARRSSRRPSCRRRPSRRPPTRPRPPRGRRAGRGGAGRASLRRHGSPHGFGPLKRCRPERKSGPEEQVVGPPPLPRVGLGAPSGISKRNRCVSLNPPLLCAEIRNVTASFLIGALPMTPKTPETADPRRWWTLVVLCFSLLVISPRQHDPQCRRCRRCRRTSAPRARSCSGSSTPTCSSSPACC